MTENIAIDFYLKTKGSKFSTFALPAYGFFLPFISACVFRLSLLYLTWCSFCLIGGTCSHTLVKIDILPRIHSF